MFRPQIVVGIICFILILPISIDRAHSATLICKSNEQKLKVFYTERDSAGWNAFLKGKIISIGSRLTTDKDNASKSIQDKTKVLIRLYSHFGIKIGDILYIINDRNLIISKVRVKSIFKSETFGFLLIGHGCLRLANIGDRAVQRIESEYSKYALIYRARGDYYQEIGQNGKAISLYKSAIELDKGNPEAHLSLANIYLDNNMHDFAMKEFSEAYKYIARLYDNEDKYLLLKGMVEVRFKEAFYMELPNDLRKRYINEGIKYSKEALQIYPKSKEINFYLGIFYYKNPDPHDVDAKNQFLKVIELDPQNIDAYLALSELYYKHRNKEKAKEYADLALKIDPADDRARSLYNLTR